MAYEVKLVVLIQCPTRSLADAINEDVSMLDMLEGDIARTIVDVVKHAEGFKPADRKLTMGAVSVEAVED